MKRSKYFITTMIALLSLTACGSKFYDSDDQGDRSLIYLDVLDTKTDGYYTGETFANSVTYKAIAYYSDGSFDEVTPSTFKVTNFKSVDGYECSGDTPVTRAGTYIAAITAVYTEGEGEDAVSVSGTDNVTVTFNSVFEAINNGDITDSCTGFAAHMNNVIVPNKKIVQQLDLTCTFTWGNHGNEILDYTSTNTIPGVSYMLHLKDQAEDVTDQIIQEGKDYVLDVKYGSLKSQINFRPALGYKKVAKEDLTVLPKDFNGAYAPNATNSTVYVIPITFVAGDPANEDKLLPWDAEALTKLQESYQNTFIPYYQGLGINFTVTIGDVYTESRAALTVETVAGQAKPYTLLFSVFAEAFAKERAKHDSNYWKQFDVDGDGQIDNIHFISNYIGSSWGSALWPHQSQTFNPNADPEKIVANVYTLNRIDRATNALDLTSVHEQGHAFGLLDYYDYTEIDGDLSNINYIGNVDMQSSNTYDWNSYSKLSCGLASPYVVTGYDSSVEITIQPSATNGDCIIVPANYQTWNGSAYDEYFLVELFANTGNNAQFWGFSENYGVRIYHVDSRLFNQLTQQEAVAEEKASWPNLGVSIGVNNCSDYSALGIGSPAMWGDYKQLCLLQKGKVDTFGKNGASRHDLEVEDMFYAGDKMTFADYKHFLSKSGKAITTMDNGESFPWTIEVVAASASEATIRISK